jgi:hypothetical protein
MVLDEAARLKFYNSLVDFRQKSGFEPSDHDVNLLGTFGTDDTALEQLLDLVS